MNLPWVNRFYLGKSLYSVTTANVIRFFTFSPASLTHSSSFWYGLKVLFTVHSQRTKLSVTVKMMASQAVERNWIRKSAVKCTSGAKGLKGKENLSLKQTLEITKSDEVQVLDLFTLSTNDITNLLFSLFQHKLNVLPVHNVFKYQARTSMLKNPNAIRLLRRGNYSERKEVMPPINVYTIRCQ